MVMEKIDDLLHKDMTRKEFLTTVGLGVATIFGFSAIFRLLTGKSLTVQQGGQYSYGGGPYGGHKNT
jgi:hypothetical protein